ncbi:MAG: DUF2339 domain-containing protein, partial [Chitinophagaceae bacterium]
MDIVLLILLIILIVLVLSALNRQREQIRDLSANIWELRNEFRKSREHSSQTAISQVSTEPEDVVQPSNTDWSKAPPEPEVVPPVAVPEPFRPVIVESADPAQEPEPVFDAPPPVIEQPLYDLRPKQESQEGWFTRWLKNNPDLEKFIGENLINKIGIAILVLGIAFFVKYAIDQEWINETGRVCIGLGAGALLTGLAHYLR